MAGADPTKLIWSPAGGWYPDPKYWRRNTALTLLFIGAICVPASMWSAKHEVHHTYPIRPIPSQRWCKNFPPAPEEELSVSSD